VFEKERKGKEGHSFFSLLSCRRSWLLGPKAETQTRPQTTVYTDLCRLVGGLRCWCLRAHFASTTCHINMLLVKCCQMSQTTCHSSRSLVPGQFLKSGSIATIAQ